MPGPRLNELLDVVEPYAPFKGRSLRVAADSIVEAGLIARGPGGRGALERTQEEAAALILGVFCAPVAASAGEYAKRLVGCNRSSGYLLDSLGVSETHATSLLKTALLFPTVGEVMTFLVRNAAETRVALADVRDSVSKKAKDKKKREYRFFLTVPRDPEHLTVHIEAEVMATNVSTPAFDAMAVEFSIGALYGENKKPAPRKLAAHKAELIEVIEPLLALGALFTPESVR